MLNTRPNWKIQQSFHVNCANSHLCVMLLLFVDNHLPWSRIESYSGDDAFKEKMGCDKVVHLGWSI